LTDPTLVDGVVAVLAGPPFFSRSSVAGASLGRVLPCPRKRRARRGV